MDPRELTCYLDKFSQEVQLSKEQFRLLKMFKEWLQKQHPASRLMPIKNWEELLEDLYHRVEKYLLKEGIAVKCWSAARWGKQNNSTICLLLSRWRDNIFYRLCRTQLRKGPYAGKKVIMTELVMDGHKHSVFLPLLEYCTEIESRLGYSIERESLRMEQTGKYRFRMCYPLEGNTLTEFDCEKIARKIAEFIAITSEYVEKVTAVKTG